MASSNGARYLKDGKIAEVAAGGTIMDIAEPKPDIEEVPLPLEGYPNRDSLKYRELYNISEASTVLRGTLRYQVIHTGWGCVTLLSAG